MKVALFKIAQWNSFIIWATFVIKFVAKKFKTLHNLVTLTVCVKVRGRKEGSVWGGATRSSSTFRRRMTLPWADPAPTWLAHVSRIVWAKFILVWFHSRFECSILLLNTLVIFRRLLGLVLTYLPTCLMMSANVMHLKSFWNDKTEMNIIWPFKAAPARARARSEEELRHALALHRDLSLAVTNRSLLKLTPTGTNVDVPALMTLADATLGITVDVERR